MKRESLATRPVLIASSSAASLPANSASRSTIGSNTSGANIVAYVRSSAGGDVRVPHDCGHGRHRDRRLDHRRADLAHRATRSLPWTRMTGGSGYVVRLESMLELFAAAELVVLPATTHMIDGYPQPGLVETVRSHLVAAATDGSVTAGGVLSPSTTTSGLIA